MVTANDLLPLIKKFAVSFLEEIGANDGDQEFYIFQYLTMALRKLANVAYLVKTSDPLTLSGDGYVTFKLSGGDITNLYSPLRILDPNGRETAKRTSFVDTKGWWRESANTQININGFTLLTNPLAAGSYTMHYLAYPATVATSTSPIEFPDVYAMGLCYFTAAMIGESFVDSDKNIVNHYYGLAYADMGIATQANIDARGHSSGGFIPSMATTNDIFRRGG